MRDYHKKQYQSPEPGYWSVIVIILVAYLLAELDWDRIFGVIQ